MRAGRVIPLSNYSVQGVTVQTADASRMSCTVHKQAQEIPMKNLNVQAVHVPSVHRDKLVVQENNTCVQDITVQRYEAPVHQESVDVHNNKTTAHQDEFTVHSVVQENSKEDQQLIETSKNESSLV